MSQQSWSSSVVSANQVDYKLKPKKYIHLQNQEIPRNGCVQTGQQPQITQESNATQNQGQKYKVANPNPRYNILFENASVLS
jgi:hypothetical protein